jgi:pseudomonalisin
MSTKSYGAKICMILSLFALPAFSGALNSQDAATPESRLRITQPISNTRFKILANTIHPQVAGARDLGRVDALAPMDQMLLVLNGSPAQEAALDQFLAEQHDSASPNYRHWLTPEQFGERFGVAPGDLEAIGSWLRGYGFVVNDFNAGRRIITFSGVVDQVEKAFHTEMHHYQIKGRMHVANATDLAIPAEIADVVEGLSLHSFRSQSLHRIAAAGQSRAPRVNGAAPIASNGASPETTLVGGGQALSPYDYATIYNIAPLWNTGTDGTGQTIAIVGRSVVSQGDFATFRAMFGLPASTLQVVTTSYDASSVEGSDTVEATLDVEWAGAVAKGATILLAASTGSQTTDGVALAAAYVVNNNLAPVMSVSFGECEAYLGSGNAFYESLWQQAASQGISVFVAAGDNGAAGCDASASSAASQGFAVNGLASTAYNVAVGGTQFNEGSGSYWNPTNNGQLASATAYIPEEVWNEGGLWAGSGGVSAQHLAAPWQAGNGVPTSDPGDAGQHHRYLPDVSLTAAAHDGYVIVSGGGLWMASGTSASAPSFAGIMALVNQATGARNGLPNPSLYALAASTPSIFHDITVGSNAVPCISGTADCSSGVLNGYNAGAGYDLAAGWGSVDVYALASNWANASPLPADLTPNRTIGSAPSQTRRP